CAATRVRTRLAQRDRRRRTKLTAGAGVTSDMNGRIASRNRHSHSIGTASFKLVYSRWHLVHQLRPQVFEHCPHFIRDMVDALDLQHVLVQAFYLAAENTGL